MSVISVNGKAAVGPIKEDKAAHQSQDRVSGLGFRRGSWAEAGPMDVLDCPAVCEEEPHHVHTGQDHEGQAQDTSCDHGAQKGRYLLCTRAFRNAVRQRKYLIDLRGVVGRDNIHDDPDVDQHVEDLKQKESRKNAGGDSGLEPRTPRVAGSDNYSLKHTQQGRCTEGKTLADSEQVEHCLTTSVIQKMSSSKVMYYFWDPTEKKCHDIS